MRAKGLTSLFQRADIQRADIRSLSPPSIRPPLHELQLLTFRVEPAPSSYSACPAARLDSTRARLPREHNEINERESGARTRERDSRETWRAISLFVSLFYTPLHPL